jgi:hypothetical protein
MTTFSRAWSMPSRWTFSIPPINDFVARWLEGRTEIVDPFAGQSHFANHRNDLAESGQTALEWLDSLESVMGTGWADAVILDPPYSPRQISECYKSVGKSVGMTDTQTARLYSDTITYLDRLLRPGGVALRFGWSSAGFGKGRGYRMDEVLLVAHGGAHNDTICTAETKQASLFDIDPHNAVGEATDERNGRCEI